MSHSLTPHPRFANHFIVESGNWTPLAIEERQRIARVLRQAAPIEVRKSSSIAAGQPQVRSTDANDCFDSAPFFARLASPRVQASKSVSHDATDANAVFDSLFPFVR